VEEEMKEEEEEEGVGWVRPTNRRRGMPQD